MNVEQRRIQCWDIDAGYAAAHEKYRNGELPPSDSQLALLGFEEITLWVNPYFTKEIASELDERDYLAAESIEAVEICFMETFRSIIGLLHQYFQSGFAPAFCSMLKMGPMGKEIDDSYRWHRDSGPSSHLKLVIYLNDDHDGATAVMSREDSRKFIDAGYLEQERLFHLDDFASEHGITYKPYKVQPKAGSGLIFEPANVLHKGIYPTVGERRVFQVGIIPWGKPWESFYEEYWAKGYTNSNGFPRYEGGLD